MVIHFIDGSYAECYEIEVVGNDIYWDGCRYWPVCEVSWIEDDYGDDITEEYLGYPGDITCSTKYGADMCSIGASSDEGKIYTFEFTYDNPDDDFHSIQFCAESLAEAEKLFYGWAKGEGNWANPTYTNCEVVYDADDADEYGDRYGTPEEYNG